MAWALGHDPTRRFIVASYSADFAAELHRQFRQVVKSAYFAELFPGTKWEKETTQEFVTTRGGGRYATSVGGTLTGRGGDTIIVDDPLNANEAQSEVARKKVIDWFVGTLVSRLNDKRTGAIIAVMQRLHEDDLAGHLLRQGGWVHLDMPAIALADEVFGIGHGRTHRRGPGDVLHPERESLAALDNVKKEIGSLLFSAQYQQRPVPVEGNLIRRDWLRQYDPADLPASSYSTQIVQSWDVAMVTGNHNDYSVGTTWRADKDDVYLLDVFRGRLEYPDLRRRVIAVAQDRRAATILIEDAGPGTSLLQDLRRSIPSGLTRPIGVKPAGSKAERMVAQSAMIEACHVALPTAASWLADFLSELLAFPNGRHDDQVDSVSQFLLWWQNHRAHDHVPIVVPFIASRPRRFP